MSEAVAVSADGDGGGLIEEKIRRPIRRVLMVYLTLLVAKFFVGAVRLLPMSDTASGRLG